MTPTLRLSPAATGISAAGKVAGLKRLNQHTQIYGYTDESVWIQFSFEERPFEASDPLAAVNRLFKYCSLEVRFPEEATENSRIYTQLRGPLRTLDETKDFQNMKDLILTFESCEDGRLKGSIEGTITRLTTRTEGPNQRTGDMMGFGHEDKDVEIPFIVEFDLTIE